MSERVNEVSGSGRVFGILSSFFVARIETDRNHVRTWTSGEGLRIAKREINTAFLLRSFLLSLFYGLF